MIYTLSTEKAGQEALQAISRRFRARHESAPVRRLAYYDTFDWRLHRIGAVLRAEDAALVYAGLDGTTHHRLALAAGSPVPAVAEEFPAGPMRDAVAPVIQMRRLLPRLEVERHDEILHLLDDLDKTVVRVRLVLGTAAIPPSPLEASNAKGGGRAPLMTVLEVEPLRGFDGELAAFIEFVESDLGLTGSGYDDFTMALAAVGRRPRDYSSKLELMLDREAASAAAVCKIHRHLLDTLRRNFSGTRHDLDSEFLHDFRVAVRRTRSALTQLKGVFPAADVERFKTEFSWLGTLTGPTRDLDVYQLKIDDYEASLPEEIRADLAPLREYLHRHQRIEQELLAKELQGVRWTALQEAWENFLRGPRKSCREETPNAGRPLGELASERIWRGWRRLFKKGSAIDDESPAQAVHDLRIDAKKLRYLLEFFRGLYEPATVDRLVKALKRLQDNLGDFNDYEVQREKLRVFAAGMEEEGLASAPALLAMGELVAHLRDGQARERERFAKRFAEFTRKENRRAFRQLFG